jgi:hypothetical protein
VVLGLDVLCNGFLCTGYLGALSCVLYIGCMVPMWGVAVRLSYI